MLIVADRNMPLLDEFFGPLGEIRRVEGRRMGPDDVAGADLLLVRSVTRVDQHLLARAQPAFVGSATIGTDHVDLGYLRARGIPFASAPGCNAIAVAEYVATVLALHAGRRAIAPDRLRLGVVGCGNVGRAVIPRAQAMGLAIGVCDPFVDTWPAGTQSFPLDELLAWADVLTLHVPLTRDGVHPTRHLLDARRLAAGRWQLLINTARGPVVDNRALAELLARDPDRSAVLDVWEDEPAVPPALLERVWLGSPHIAGYSVEGKWRGTAMVYEAACRALGIPPSTTLAAIRAAKGEEPRRLPAAGSLAEILTVCCDLPGDDARLRAIVTGDPVATAKAFDALRSGYGERREFSAWQVPAETKTPRAMLAALGFTTG